MLARCAVALGLFALLPTVAAAQFPFQVCTVMLLEETPAPEALREARKQISDQGCEPGDALVVIGSGFEARAMAAALCRRGAAVQISELRGAVGPEAQLDCELPILPRLGWSRR